MKIILKPEAFDSDKEFFTLRVSLSEPRSVQWFEVLVKIWVSKQKIIHLSSDGAGNDTPLTFHIMNMTDELLNKELQSEIYATIEQADICLESAEFRIKRRQSICNILNMKDDHRP